jgi:broad specificity phosphatase PhoE
MGCFNIFLIRHGQSEQNIGKSKGIFDGDVKLTEQGRFEAIKAGDKMYELVQQQEIDLSKARFWTSSYERAIETTQIINEKLKVLDVFEDSRLVEQDFGLWDGLSEEECEKITPLEYQLYKKRQSTPKGKFFAKPAGGESPAEVCVRISTFLETIMRDRKEGIDTLFITSHGITMRCFVMRYYHKNLEWYYNVKNPKNCEIWQILQGANDPIKYQV